MFVWDNSRFLCPSLPAAEALIIFVWVLIRFPSWACRSLLLLHLAYALITLLALASVFALLLVQSSDDHRLRRVHQCGSREHTVADLFVELCVRVESTGMHHEVV